MTRMILPLGAALAVSLAVPAFANDAQLAASVGVEPGVYTTAELIQLSTAMADDNSIMMNHILRDGPETISTQSAAANQGNQQLADFLGVNVNDYTTSELAAMYIDATD
ncbi:hypothetical protein GTA62_06930 [Roseobacter sp. HKCCD9010]|jgi:hypothetical protein|uniref:hypothetical protein n=1 Tax=unclassified Roseobacter TaxID=196798 RepID=UPI00119AFE05|nr:MULTISPECIES: hypothetical protein [unclassified Roseobacter]MBF9048395.1 hypothetical protein [Rhodobacterales bacterium HKCCD4356]NNV10394.1 hypothetical protein [Roseobacter sp. HKCCD7357]NNV14579.1 hypothetical protein [Roseobacter sp. HKCCD8768]NNV24038.1 hypothetical protein [Roseobacter sp. HKCCD8192]NNV28295.1 hypothetical protein [Roseobacter sp. HKCCD9061]